MPPKSDASEFEKVRDYFTRSAEGFDSLYAEETLNPFLRLVNRTFRPDMYERFMRSLDHVRAYQLQTALDVGCGPGRYLSALAQLGLRRIVGLDCSEAMLERARENTSFIPDRDERVHFVCSDFTAFTTDETYDVVLAMGFYDYIKNPISVLQKMRHLAYHSVIASFPSISVYRTPIRKLRYHFKRCPVYFYNRGTIQALASQAGFRRTDIFKIRGSGQDYFVTFFK